MSYLSEKTAITIMHIRCMHLNFMAVQSGVESVRPREKISFPIILHFTANSKI
jgi:hypothetical protein